MIRIGLKFKKNSPCPSIPDVEGPFVTEYLEHRKRSRLPDIVDRNKERLRIRFGIEVRKEEMARRKDEIEVEQGQGSSD